jgi:hypothetical protein
VNGHERKNLSLLFVVGSIFLLFVAFVPYFSVKNQSNNITKTSTGTVYSYTTYDQCKLVLNLITENNSSVQISKDLRTYNYRDITYCPEASKYQTGDKVVLTYNPNNPSEFYLGTYASAQEGSKVATVVILSLSFICLITSIYLYFTRNKNKKNGLPSS